MPKQVCWSSRPPLVLNVAGILSRLDYSWVKTKLLMCYFCVTERESATKRHKKHKGEPRSFPLCFLCLFAANSFLSLQQPRPLFSPQLELLRACSSCCSFLHCRRAQIWVRRS